MEYRLFPPILVVPEDDSFWRTWESFCCKLLNLENRTNDIVKWNPPDSGIDLYFHEKGIAYQCKSVENPKGSLRVDDVLKSVDSALQAQAEIGWVQYVLCTNIGITGAQERKLRKAFPEIVIRPNSYWTSLCKKYSEAVRGNFRQLVSISMTQLRSIPGNVVLAESLEQIASDSFYVLFYSEQYNRIFKVPASETLTVADLKLTLTLLLKLPFSRPYTRDNIFVNVRYDLVFRENVLGDRHTLKESGISLGDVLFLRISVDIRDTLGQVNVRGLGALPQPSQNNSVDMQVRSSRVERDILSKYYRALDQFWKQCTEG